MFISIYINANKLMLLN